MTFFIDSIYDRSEKKFPGQQGLNVNYLLVAPSLHSNI